MYEYISVTSASIFFNCSPSLHFTPPASPHHVRCEGKIDKANGTFEALISEEWRDDCPKPWLSETVPGTCAHMMACRAFKYMSFFNISHWAPNVEVCASGRNTLGEDGTRGGTSTAV